MILLNCSIALISFVFNTFFTNCTCLVISSVLSGFNSLDYMTDFIFLRIYLSFCIIIILLSNQLSHQFDCFLSFLLCWQGIHSHENAGLIIITVKIVHKWLSFKTRRIRQSMKRIWWQYHLIEFIQNFGWNPMICLRFMKLPRHNSIAFNRNAWDWP